MHSMSESATLRDRRRWETEHRITRCAQRLTEEHGLDGFTMDDLAAAAGVSRRTLFNYFSGKIDAVLGGRPEIPADDLARFRAGGPHGDLVQDLAEIARRLLVDHALDHALDRDAAALVRRLMTTTPRLFVAAHERFETVSEEFVTLILAREGDAFGAPRARLLVRILVAVFDSSLLTFIDDPGGRELVEIFDENLRTARDHFA